MLSSFPVSGSALARGDLAALFSEAIMDNGRLLDPVDPREEGRCCHERVPARGRGIAALGDISESTCGFEGGRGSPRGLALISELSSFGGAPLGF